MAEQRFQLVYPERPFYRLGVFLIRVYNLPDSGVETVLSELRILKEALQDFQIQLFFPDRP